MEIEHRLYQMYTHIQNLIHVFTPDAVAVEEPFFGGGEHQYARSTMAIGQAQGLVLIGAASQGIPVLRYAPTQIKQSIVDYGRASKLQVQETICNLLNLSSKPDSDAADALAIAVCHLSQSQSKDILSREIAPGQER
jgi:crossover junction endodeoxyribonuclease RuvC